MERGGARRAGRAPPPLRELDASARRLHECLTSRPWRAGQPGASAHAACCAVMGPLSTRGVAGARGGAGRAAWDPSRRAGGAASARPAGGGGGERPAAPATWGAVTPRCTRFGAWHLPVREWRWKGDAVSTWERAPSHLEQSVAARACGGGGGGSGGGGDAGSARRPFASLPGPTDAWTGRRRGGSAAGEQPGAAAGALLAAAAAAAAAIGGAPLPAHSRFLGASGGGGGGGGGGAQLTATRADSVAMTNHVVELERSARRAERAAARVARQLTGSFGLRAYKSARCRARLRALLGAALHRAAPLTPSPPPHHAAQPSCSSTATGRRRGSSACPRRRRRTCGRRPSASAAARKTRSAQASAARAARGASAAATVAAAAARVPASAPQAPQRARRGCRGWRCMRSSTRRRGLRGRRPSQPRAAPPVRARRCRCRERTGRRSTRC